MSIHKPGQSGTFADGAACACGAGGGVVLSHAGCVALMAGTAGAAGAMGATMTGAMMLASPLLAAGMTRLIDRWRGRETSAARLGASAGLAFALAAAGLAVQNYRQQSDVIEPFGPMCQTRPVPAPAPLSGP